MMPEHHSRNCDRSLWSGVRRNGARAATGWRYGEETTSTWMYAVGVDAGPQEVQRGRRGDRRIRVGG